MKHFALLFRTSFPLSLEQQRRRQIAIVTWAENLQQQGIEIDPRRFDNTLGEFIFEDGEVKFHSIPSDEGLSNVVFFDAENEDIAMHVARTHPGPRYGARLEVRQWDSPRAASQMPQESA